MTIATEHFCFTCHEADEAFARLLAARADRLHSELQSRFGFQAAGEESIAVVVCATIEEYLRSTGKTAAEYQEWMVGNSDFERRQIALLSPRISITHTGPELEKVFAHELIHMLFDLHTGGAEAPIWCAEGVAVLYAEQMWVDQLKEADCPFISQLEDEDTFAQRGGYEYAGAYVWYFIRQHGFAAFLDLYRREPAAAALLCTGFEESAVRALRAAVLLDG